MAKKKNIGQYYKYRTKRYFKNLGYDVTLSEFIFRQGQFFVKKDIFGSDVIAMNDKEILFINSKFMGNRESGWTAKSDGLKEFRNFRFPSQARPVLALWKKGARHPELVYAPSSKKDNSQEPSQ